MGRIVPIAWCDPLFGSQEHVCSGKKNTRVTQANVLAFGAKPPLTISETFMNVFCLGGKVIGSALAWELVETFLAAHFSDAARHQRRVSKLQALEIPGSESGNHTGINDGSFGRPTSGRGSCFVR
jgi:Ribose/Galactose Isomerase